MLDVDVTNILYAMAGKEKLCACTKYLCTGMHVYQSENILCSMASYLLNDSMLRVMSSLKLKYFLKFLSGRLFIYCWKPERGKAYNSLVSGTSLFVCVCVSGGGDKTSPSQKDEFFYCRLISLQLSVYKGAGGLQALMKSKVRKLAEQDELTLVASGIPYTIIRAGLLQNTPGGKQGFSFEEVLFNPMLAVFVLWMGNFILDCSLSTNKKKSYSI